MERSDWTVSNNPQASACMSESHLQRHGFYHVNNSERRYTIKLQTNKCALKIRNTYQLYIFMKVYWAISLGNLLDVVHLDFRKAFSRFHMMSLGTKISHFVGGQSIWAKLKQPSDYAIDWSFSERAIITETLSRDKQILVECKRGFCPCSVLHFYQWLGWLKLQTTQNWKW